MTSLVLTAAIVVVALTGCSKPADNPPLPDLATASPSAPQNKQDMTPADQKRAIDAMIAKRDAQTKAAKEIQRPNVQ